MTQVTNGQLSLEEAAKRLTSKVVSTLKDIEADEAPATTSYSRLAQSSAFTSLRLKVSRKATELIEQEWSQLVQATAKGEDLSIAQQPCECQILLRYSIACRHHLYRSFHENIPIPITLLHPRWWLHGPPITQPNWQPFYPTITSSAPPSSISTSLSAVIKDIRNNLNPEERERFDRQLLQEQRHIQEFEASRIENLVKIGQQRLQIQEIPIRQPDPVSRSGYIPRSAHINSNRRGLMAGEIQDRQQRQERQQQLQEQRRQRTLAQEQMMSV